MKPVKSVLSTCGHLAAATTLLLVAGCDQGEVPLVVTATGPDVAVPEVATFSVAETQAGSMFIRRAEIVLQVADADSAAAEFRRIVEAIDGRVERAVARSASRTSGRTHQFVVRIPESRLEESVERVLALGSAERTMISASEVTEQAIDLDVRLRNGRRLEERLLRLLGEQTSDLENVLAVERELARVRSEVERYDAQLKKLEYDVAWSRMVAELHEPHPLTARQSGGIGRRLRRAFARSADNLLDFVEGAIAALGYIIPLAVLSSALIGLWRWSRRRWSRRQIQTSE